MCNEYVTLIAGDGPLRSNALVCMAGLSETSARQSGANPHKIRVPTRVDSQCSWEHNRAEQEDTMSNISGSFSAYVRAETTLFAEDQPNHQLQLSEIHATQKSPDPSWNNARLTYYGIAD